MIFLLLQVPQPVLVLACVLLDAFATVLFAGDGAGGVPCSSPVSGEPDALPALDMSGGIVGAARYTVERSLRRTTREWGDESEAFV